MPGCDGPPGISQGRHPAAGHPQRQQRI